MNKFINTLKSVDPMLAIAFTMNFAVAFMLGQHTTAKDASEVQAVYSDQANGRFVSTDDPIFFPDNIPVLEPIDCEPEDKECLEQNEDVGKPAHYPSICEPYIFPNEHKERNL